MCSECAQPAEGGLAGFFYEKVNIHSRVLLGMGTVLLGAAAALFCSVSLDVTPLVTCSIDRRLEMMLTAASIG